MLVALAASARIAANLLAAAAMRTTTNGEMLIVLLGLLAGCGAAPHAAAPTTGLVRARRRCCH